MTQHGWRELVLEAVKRSENGDPELLSLLVQLLVEQDTAKQRLRDLGYGCTGMPWLQMVDEIRQAQP